MQSCRDALMGLGKEGEEGTNASLLMARYLKEAKGKAEKEDSEKSIAARAELFGRMQKAASAAYPLYAKAFQRRREALDGVSAARTFETIGPMVAGLGNANALETGLSLNPLYGAPMIPGSSLKGVVAHYCSQVLGEADPAYKGPALDERNRPTQKAGELYEALFGKVDRVYEPDGTVRDVPAEDMSGGWLRFYDAWIEPESLKGAFTEDVMTPHHMEYYGGEAALPSDFDKPNPVAFMAVQGKFEVRVGCVAGDMAEEARAKWLAFALDLAEMALKNWGAGGKTRAGYGRMQPVPSAGEVKAKAAQAKAQELKEAGWAYAAGDTVTVECVGFKSFKGEPKPQFAIAGGTDGKGVRLEPRPEAEKGQTFAAKVKRIEKSNNVYVLEKID